MLIGIVTTPNIGNASLPTEEHFARGIDNMLMLCVSVGSYIITNLYVNTWTYRVSVLDLTFTLTTRIHLIQHSLFTNELKTSQIIQLSSENVHSQKVLSCAFVTNNAGSGLEERVNIFLTHTVHVIISLSLFLNFIIHCYTH
jgi:hypothetical protein